ncbi:MAG: sensor histidine kinase, partial [Limisphaerales bacterium]
LMEPYAAERGVALAFTLGDGQQTSGPLDIAVDGKAIQQALINLIDNAIKHSPKGQSVTVALDLDANATNAPLPSVLPPPPAGPPSGAINQAPSSRIHLWVEDRGEGIPAAEHEKIFERFYRRGSELRRETSGVGIGLSIVKHIIEAHGGQVSVRSGVGQGSRFTICLPLERAVDDMPHE